MFSPTCTGNLGSHESKHLDDVLVKIGGNYVDHVVFEEEREGTTMHFSIDGILYFSFALLIHVFHDDEIVEGFLVGLVEGIDLSVVRACEHLLREDIRLRVDAFAGREITNDHLCSDPKDDTDHELFGDEFVVLGAEVFFETIPKPCGFFSRGVGKLTFESVHECASCRESAFNFNLVLSHCTVKGYSDSVIVHSVGRRCSVFLYLCAQGAVSI